MCSILIVHNIHKRTVRHIDGRLVIHWCHRRCAIKKTVHKNFSKIVGKHLCKSRFFNKVDLVNFAILQISKNIFFTEHIQVNAFVLNCHPEKLSFIPRKTCFLI